MLEIDLIRHVKVMGKPALYGSTDVAPIVTENARLLECLITQQKTSNAYQSVISSSLNRCQTIAKEFSLRCKLPLALSRNLQEMNFGCFDGVPFDDLSFKDPVVHNKSYPPPLNAGEYHGAEKTKLHWSQLEAFFQAPAEIILPEAEALSAFHQRVLQAWQALIEQQVAIATEQKELPMPRRVLVIAHGGVIRMILAHILQLDWQQPSWHQKLQIGHGSMSRVVISQPYQDKPQQQLNQQVTSIAMPFIEEL